MRDPHVLLALMAVLLSGGLARGAQGDEAKLTVEQVQELLSTTGNLSGRDLRGMNLTGIDMSRADLRSQTAASGPAGSESLMRPALPNSCGGGRSAPPLNLRVARAAGVAGRR